MRNGILSWLAIVICIFSRDAPFPIVLHRIGSVDFALACLCVECLVHVEFGVERVGQFGNLSSYLSVVFELK